MTIAMQGQKNVPFPTSAGSSDGLLPWLFGGSNNSDTAPPAGVQTSVPENAPFAHANDGKDQPVNGAAPQVIRVGTAGWPTSASRRSADAR